MGDNNQSENMDTQKLLAMRLMKEIADLDISIPESSNWYLLNALDFYCFLNNDGIKDFEKNTPAYKTCKELLDLQVKNLSLKYIDMDIVSDLASNEELFPDIQDPALRREACLEKGFRECIKPILDAYTVNFPLIPKLRVCFTASEVIEDAITKLQKIDAIGILGDLEVNPRNLFEEICRIYNDDYYSLEDPAYDTVKQYIADSFYNYIEAYFGKEPLTKYKQLSLAITLDYADPDYYAELDHRLHLPDFESDIISALTDKFVRTIQDERNYDKYGHKFIDSDYRIDANGNGYDAEGQAYYKIEDISDEDAQSFYEEVVDAVVKDMMEYSPDGWFISAVNGWDKANLFSGPVGDEVYRKKVAKQYNDRLKESIETEFDDEVAAWEDEDSSKVSGSFEDAMVEKLWSVHVNDDYLNVTKYDLLDFLYTDILKKIQYEGIKEFLGLHKSRVN